MRATRERRALPAADDDVNEEELSPVNGAASYGYDEDEDEGCAPPPQRRRRVYYGDAAPLQPHRARDDGAAAAAEGYAAEAEHVNPALQAYWRVPSAPAVDLDAIRASANSFVSPLYHGPVPLATHAATYGAPPRYMPPLRPWVAGASHAPAAPQAFAFAAPQRPHVHPPPAPRGGGEEDPIELLDSDSDAPPPPPPPPPPPAAADDDEVVLVDDDEVSEARRELWEQQRLRRQEQRRMKAAALRASEDARNLKFWTHCAEHGRPPLQSTDKRRWEQVAKDWRSQNMDAVLEREKKGGRAAEGAAKRAPAARSAPRASARPAQHAPPPPPPPPPPPQAPPTTQPRARDSRASLAANVAEFAASAAARRADPRYSEQERAADDAMLENARKVVSSLFRDGAEDDDGAVEFAAVPNADAVAASGVEARDDASPSEWLTDQEHHAAPDGCAQFDGDATVDPAVVLDRAAARDGAADAAEWEERAVELARQREAARRERVRRRNEAQRAAELAQRQISRVSELRASAAAAANAAGQEEHQRVRARAALHLLTHHCTSLGSLLVALKVMPAGWPLSGPREITAAYRLAALRFHPDRGRTRNAEDAAFAEEAFKLIAKMKSEL